MPASSTALRAIALPASAARRQQYAWRPRSANQTLHGGDRTTTPTAPPGHRDTRPCSRRSATRIGRDAASSGPPPPSRWPPGRPPQAGQVATTARSQVGALRTAPGTNRPPARRHAAFAVHGGVGPPVGHGRFHLGDERPWPPIWSRGDVSSRSPACGQPQALRLSSPRSAWRGGWRPARSGAGPAASRGGQAEGSHGSDYAMAATTGRRGCAAPRPAVRQRGVPAVSLRGSVGSCQHLRQTGRSRGIDVVPLLPRSGRLGPPLPLPTQRRATSRG